MDIEIKKELIDFRDMLKEEIEELSPNNSKEINEKVEELFRYKFGSIDVDVKQGCIYCGNDKLENGICKKCKTNDVELRKLLIDGKVCLKENNY